VCILFVVCMCTYINACVYVYVCMYVCMFICLSVLPEMMNKIEYMELDIPRVFDTAVAKLFMTY